MAHVFLRSSNRLAPFTAGVGVALALSCQASAERNPSGARVPVPLTISVSPQSPEAVTVSKDVLVVAPDDAVALQAEGLPAGYTLEVEFTGSHAKSIKDPKTGTCQHGDKVIHGPFPPGNAKQARGRYAFDAQTLAVTTLQGDQCSATAWRYEVTLRDGSGADVYVLDPMIILK
jgi:hypothetical protein